MNRFLCILNKPSSVSNVSTLWYNILKPGLKNSSLRILCAQHSYYTTLQKPQTAHFHLKDSATTFLNVRVPSFSTSVLFCSTVERDKGLKGNTEEEHTNKIVPLSRKAKLKQAVRDYGSTVIVFHVGISLMSLGFFYLLVANGLDVVGLLQKLGFSEAVVTSKMAAGGSTMVIAYAVHKLFAPVRIGITLAAVPFIVRHLRKIGFLKPPKSRQL